MRLHLPEGLSLKPNPCNELLEVSSVNLIKNIIVSNILGKQVLRVDSINSNEIKIDVSEFDNGLYFISIINSDNNVILRKFSKN
jgi:hypothetical protein